MPQMFCDGEKIYQQFADEYVRHDKGLFILAPSGAGKTHFVNHQTSKDWIDGDKLWTACGAHPDRAWWTEGDDAIAIIDQKSDVITGEAKRMGFWIMGASNYWLRPDAIVLPEWERHKEMIRLREETDYDGGATSDDHKQVLGHREWMERIAKGKDIPIFQSIEQAVNALTA